MDDLLQSDVLDRLDREGLKDRVADLVVAALRGDIEACLGGNTPSRLAIQPKQIEPPDGTSGAALGVMSQGELHSLALALFLPRATLEVRSCKTSSSK